VNHTEEELKTMLSLVEASRREDSDRLGLRGSPLNWVLAKFMTELLHGRFLNFYGQPTARLSRFRPIYRSERSGTNTGRSSLINILSPMLFYAPALQLHTLEKLWVDRVLAKEAWTKAVQKFVSEWIETTTYSTILLNANVAFLSIYNVSPGSINGTDSISSANSPSPPGIAVTQTLSYVSTITSVGSVILGLILVRKHRSKEKASAAEAHAFLMSWDHQKRGLEALAILYSLPYALLMFGMVFFLLAFLLMCFLSNNIMTQTLVALSCFCVSMLILWTLSLSWETDPQKWLSSKGGELKQRWKERSVGWLDGQSIISWIRRLVLRHPRPESSDLENL